MRKLSVVATIVLMLSGMAMAQDPTISFTVEIGGDNHAADFKGEVYKAFTPGTANPTGEWEGIITWDVVAAASGLEGGLGIQGIANLVFDLELQDEAGNPVAPAEFLSTVNDGSFNANAGVYYPYERAAFCQGFDTSLNNMFGPYYWDDINFDTIVQPEEYLDGVFVEGGSLAPGRLQDSVAAAGPNMDRVQFPSTSYHGGGRIKGGAYFGDCNGNLVLDSTELDGVSDADANGILDICEDLAATVGGAPATEVLSAAKLSGMGAGYSQFSLTGNNLGVGLALASVQPSWFSSFELVGLGVKPVAEGQIDMSNLPNGTYKLVLTAPANSNNVVPAIYNPNTDVGGFAVKATVVQGDEVVFFWNGGSPVTPVAPIAWSSVRTHGATERAIALDASDAVAVSETRNGGLQKLVIVFDGNLNTANYAAGGVAITGAGLSVSGEAVATTNVANDTLVLTLTGSVDQTCYTIDVSGVCTLTGGADATCKVAVITGDVNGDKNSNLIDMALIKAKNGSPAAGNEKFDVNTDDVVNLIDMALSKGWNGKTVVCP